MSDWNLEYFNSKEWQTVQEKLDDLERRRIEICPSRDNLFADLDLLLPDKVKVAIIGQDPYPNPSHATGVAFSVKRTTPKNKWPPTLVNIFKEYVSDLNYPEPTTGSLESWVSQGVLLHNAIPSCEAYKSWSHGDWLDWYPFTTEVVQKLSEYAVPIVFIGAKARQWSQYVDLENSEVYTFSHPSPRASRKDENGKPLRNNWFGSRMFSTINAQLCAEGRGKIDWRLP